MSKFRTFDIGGSGVKTALWEGTSGSDIRLISEPRLFSNPDWTRLGQYLAERIPEGGETIGISCAGFIDCSAGIVKLCRVAGWKNRPLANEFRDAFSVRDVVLLNDAEAHLAAHLDMAKHPLISLSLGTSVGFAISTERGLISRPRSDVNFDIGAMTLPTRASDNHVWWALGSPGLEELQKNIGQGEGVAHYGYRLGAFLVSLGSIFRPRIVVLSGGIVERHWKTMLPAVLSEMSTCKPDWLEDIEILRSSREKNAALWGMAKYICSIR